MIDFLKKMKKSEKLYDCLFLLFLVIIAFYLRFLRTGFGLPYLYLWDEPQTSSAALKMLKTGDYNPHFFNDNIFPYWEYFIIYLQTPLVFVFSTMTLNDNKPPTLLIKT